MLEFKYIEHGLLKSNQHGYTHTWEILINIYQSSINRKNFRAPPPPPSIPLLRVSKNFRSPPPPISSSPPLVILNELSLNKGKLTRKLFLAHQSAKKCWSPFTQLSTGYTCRSLNFSRLLRVFSTPSVSILLKVTKLGVACKATIQ